MKMSSIRALRYFFGTVAHASLVWGALWNGQHYYADLTCPSPDARWNPLEHLGANSPWSPGPNIFDISPETPDGCEVDQAVYISRHGSRYPDPGAYEGWLDLYNKIQSANFSATGPLSFLPRWNLSVDYPYLQLGQLSPGGYDELYEFGVDLRTRYPGWYRPDAPFRVWANDNPRVVDSAKLFARGYIGPNSTALGSVYAINASDPSAIANSLATTDSCPAYDDTSGSEYTTIWDSIYLPPIARRLKRYVNGSLDLDATDLSSFPYLCGFESQIRRRDSPFCNVFTPEEILQYEYRQDLRYWYGTGPGAYNNASVMLPVIQGVIDLLSSGPQTPVTENGGETGIIGPLTVAFTHDNQINQMISRLGIFDEQPPLAAKAMNESRVYVSSRNNPMRGTVTFERLNCSQDIFLRILLNDAVYPVPSCMSGPGSSCPLNVYNSQVLAKKWAEAGSFADFCNVSGSDGGASNRDGVTFFTDLTLPAMRVVKP